MEATDYIIIISIILTIASFVRGFILLIHKNKLKIIRAQAEASQRLMDFEWTQKEQLLSREYQLKVSFHNLTGR